jgi:hypothetical protein
MAQWGEVMAVAGRSEATVVGVEKGVLGNAADIIRRASFGMQFGLFFLI